MHRNRLAALAIAATTVLAGTAAGAAPSTPTVGAADADVLYKYFVAFDRDVTVDDLEALTTLGAVRALEFPTIDTVAITAPLPSVVAAASLPGVHDVQPQRRIRLDLFESVEQINAKGVDQPETYEVDGQTVERPGVTGEGVHVAVVDTGIFIGHPTFGDRVTRGLNFEFTELQQNGPITAEEWDSYAESTGDSAFNDEIGHGTHVAGIIGGNGDGAHATYDELAGVAPGVTFTAMRIGAPHNGVVEDVGFEENVIAAYDYMARHPDLGFDVANNSIGLLPTEPYCGLSGAGSIIGSEGCYGLGEDTDFDAAKAVVQQVINVGTSVVFSAGNSGPDFGTIRDDPTGLDDVITVGAACKPGSTASGCAAEGAIVATFSSRGNEDGTGPQVDVIAGGVQILSAASPSILVGLTNCRETVEPGYVCLSGTSMAAPHVAGVSALLLQANPDLTPRQVHDCINSTAVDMVSLNPAEGQPVVTEGWDVVTGHGMVDTRAALRCAHQPTVAPAAAPAPAPAPEPAPLPATGGGLALLGLLGVAGAVALRRS